MTLSVLLIESDECHASAEMQVLAAERPDWQVEVADSVAQSRALMTVHFFDVVVVSHRLNDGTVFDLMDSLTGKLAILCVMPGQEAVAAQALRQGFSDYLIKDAELGYLQSLCSRIEVVRGGSDMIRIQSESAERFELALGGADLGLWERHLISGKLTVSERWGAMLGYTQGEVEWIVNSWQDVVHPDDWKAIQETSDAYLSGRIRKYQCEYRLRHKEGHWVWVLSRGRVVERDVTGAPVRLLGTFMDITELKQTRDEFARQHRLLQAISRAQTVFITSIDAKTLFDWLLVDLLAATGSEYGFVGEVLFNAAQQPYLKIQAISDLAWDETSRRMHENIAAGAGMEVPNLNTLFGAALATGEPVISNQPERDPRRGGLPTGHLVMRSFLGLPIHSDGELVAMVGLANQPGGYSQADIDFLDPLCSTIGQMVQARRGEAERCRVQAELQKTSELLEQRTQALYTTLDSMNHGISTVDAEGRTTIYNQRYLELLDLPESLLLTRPTHEEIVRFQAGRGDFGETYDLVEAVGRDYVARGTGEAPPERYLRKTRSGTVLEVKTRVLPSGGMVRTYADVTSYVEAQEALRESVARFRSLTELSSDWYWEQDEQFRFVRFEGRQVSPTGPAGPRSASLGKTRWEVGALNMTEADWRSHRAVVEAHQTFYDFELLRVDVEGNPYWVSVSGTPIFDGEGVFRGYRGIGRNITERKRAEDETRRLAFYDPLTGLPNRRLLLDRLSQALAISARSQRHGALLFLDLDNFKDLNDTLGHDMGDKLLEQVAARLATCIREGDTVARLGGDEFVIMLEDLSDDVRKAATQVEVVSGKVLSLFEQPYDLVGLPQHSTPSIGITLFRGHLHSVDELLKRADLAMYQAKAAGRNTLRFFDPDMQAAVATRAALEGDLRHGLNNGELVLHYQAVVDTQGQLVGAEALVRWEHARRGMVSPAEFIPLAEQTGLILPLGRWVLQTACEQLVAWSAQPHAAGLTLAVNVSARQFRQSDFVAQVLEVIEYTGANPHRLKLELTESLLLNDVEDIIGKMTELKARGVGFSLDDFGTGYSSLAYLKRLPLDQLKIDQSFVRDVLTDPNDAAIVRTILALARSMDLAVVAEGVESEGQRRFLLNNGCHGFQGYLFGRPGPVTDLPLGAAAASLTS